ncbi:unnamed protein product, partial [Aphanomyces euteiches]
QQLTLNANDGIFREEAATGFDPVMEYVFVGEEIDDGIFAWISVGINASESKYVSPAVLWTAGGGVPASGGGGGPPGGPGNNGTFPPGGPPGNGPPRPRC